MVCMLYTKLLFLFCWQDVIVLPFLDFALSRSDFFGLSLQVSPEETPQVKEMEKEVLMERERVLGGSEGDLPVQEQQEVFQVV